MPRQLPRRSRARGRARPAPAPRLAHALEDHRDDAVGVLAARVVVGDDDAVGEPFGRLAHQRALAGIALAAAAEHHEHAAARVRAHCRERLGERVGRVRVVDHRERAIRQPVAFHAARAARRSRRAPRATRRRRTARPKHAERDREVLGVERADQRRTQAAFAEVAADVELEPAVRGPSIRRDVHERAAAKGASPPTATAVSSTPARQRRGKARAHRVADIDDGVLEPGQPEQARLRLGIALHRPVVIEVVARQVAERGDAQAHGVDAALVEGVRGHFHRDVARAGVRERPQLPVQRDDVRRRQRAARDLRRKSRAERAEVGAAPREALRPPRRAAMRRSSCRWCR